LSKEAKEEGKENEDHNNRTDEQRRQQLKTGKKTDLTNNKGKGEIQNTCLPFIFPLFSLPSENKQKMLHFLLTLLYPPITSFVMPSLLHPTNCTAAF
jgi:hypothetical protein